MRVAFISAQDPCNIRTWSGIPFSMFKGLQRLGVELVPFYPRIKISKRWFFIQRAFVRLLTGQRYFPDRTVSQCKKMAADLDDQLQSVSFDIILATGSLPVAFLRDNRPQVIWTDATFPGMVDFYPEYSHLTSGTRKAGVEIDRIAFTRSRWTLFSSRWAASTATDLLQINLSKVEVHYFGSNMDLELTPEEFRRSLTEKKQTSLRLLWIGVDWRRKRGDFAFGVVQALRNAKVNAELHVVGCMPPEKYRSAEWLTTHGFIAKSTQEGQQKISSLLGSSHFLILPSTAECSPIVIPEAASHGVPSLVTSVGGNSELVHNEKSGLCFNLSSSSQEVAKWVLATTRDWNRYSSLCEAAYEDYNTRINWNKSSAAVKVLLEQAVT